MATTEAYLDSIIEQANELRDLVQAGKVPNEIASSLNTEISELDDTLDTILNWVTDVIGQSND